MIWKQKIQAGALQFVLFIGAVIAVLLLSFVLVSYSHSLFQKKTEVTVAVIRASDEALKKSFAEPMEIGQIKDFGLDNTLGVTTKVSKTYWGALELRRAKAKKGSFEFERLALVGQANDERPALYLKDNQRPLVLAGNTKIQGTAYLPERGVKMGNIYGNSYYATQLIYGEEKQSQSELPKLSEEIKRQVQLLATRNLAPKGQTVPLKREMVLKNSFTQETKVIQGDVLDLDHLTLKGNIMVVASRKILVRATSQLHDVLLLAPSIKIENWVKGNFQAVATKTITVGKGVELDYPSVLAVKANGRDSLLGQSFEPNILLDSYAQVRGIVVYEDDGEYNRSKPHVKLDEHSKVYGEVYSTQNVELKGSVYGSITSAGFVALENGNIYQNHIYNGSINSEILPLEYAGISYQNTTANQVAKWVY